MFKSAFFAEIDFGAEERSWQRKVALIRVSFRGLRHRVNDWQDIYYVLYRLNRFFRRLYDRNIDNQYKL